jgi:Big-like domain-containing protein
MTRLRAFLRALQRAVRTVVSGIRLAGVFLKKTLPPLWVAIVGRWNWQAPRWITWTGGQLTRGQRYLAANPKRAAATLFVVLSLASALVWYVNLPKPHYVTYSVSAPGLTEYNDNGISSIKPLTVAFSESAARLKALQKVVTSGIEMSPAVAGSWFWVNDKELRFTPTADWPVDGAFNVQFAKRGIFRQPGSARGIRVRRQKPAVHGEHQPERVLSGSSRSEFEEARRGVEIQPSRRYTATRVARVACRRQRCRVSGPDAR